ncbi:hypothetical protein PAMA_003676 [Pampus argenteus]
MRVGERAERENTSWRQTKDPAFQCSLTGQPASGSTSLSPLDPSRITGPLSVPGPHVGSQSTAGFNKANRIFFNGAADRLLLLTDGPAVTTIEKAVNPRTSSPGLSEGTLGNKAVTLPVGILDPPSCPPT